ncbi:glycosyltransferase [Amnibacterium kyonggiense]|uniref:Glycosyl transferase family 2 n=1 Tax=Amnibacterium kyonggiense TaxID=595671 RepID=A0A4R7FDE6_9MICO|nr:glycosyltransferase [Amnibacterium kyonggiense]TDS74975.1 glycosyl transferase family 2 [Amnibacterium kyonggiense]
MEPLVSVIIAAYKPGDAFQRVMDSLDAQTLPQERFETIVVDDGSPDDTYERMQALAATRPNMRVKRIENSGWGSRPRNVGTDLARGEYVMFMDHDDSLFPDGLRAAVEFAKANRSDVVSPKESRTNDPWWAMQALRNGDVGNILPGGDIDLLRPMVPHKLYRREFLNEHGIRFPEGRRILWEDNYQNIAVFRHAKVVSLLASAPVYLWIASDTNNSRTYGPMSPEFWDRLDDLVAYIDATLDTEEFAAARKSALLHEHRWRLLHRLTKSTVANQDGPKLEQAYDRANRIQERYLPVEWDADLGVFDRIRATLIRARRTDLVRQQDAVATAISVRSEARDVRWDGAVLRFHVEARLMEAGKPIAFREEGGRLFRVMSPEAAEVVPQALLDVTDDIDRFDVAFALRGRHDPITWTFPADLTVRREPNGDGTVGMVVEGEASIDLATAQAGNPLQPGVWDVTAQSRWGGLSRRSAPRSSGSTGALTGSGAAIAYTTQKGALALDTAQRLRSILNEGPLLVDAALGGKGQAFSLALPKLTVVAPTTVRFELLAVAADGTEFRFPATVVGDDRGARLESAIRLEPGTYTLRALAEGQPTSVALPRRLTVRRDGRAQLHRPVTTAVKASLPARVAKRARRTALDAAKRLRARWRSRKQ